MRSLLSFIVFLFITITYLYSQESSNIQEMQGEVIWRGKDKIAILYKKGEGGEEEILLPIDKDTQIEHTKKFSDIERGDIVYVQFKEEIIPSADGTPVPAKKITKLSLVKKGKKKEIPAVTAGSTNEASILKSQ